MYTLENTQINEDNDLTTDVFAALNILLDVQADSLFGDLEIVDGYDANVAKWHENTTVDLQVQS